MLEKAHRPKKGAARKSDIPLLDAKVVGDLVGSVEKRWPDLRRQVSGFFQVSGEKLGDIYCSVAQAVTERKEAFEDRLAEKKSRSRAASRTTKP